MEDLRHELPEPLDVKAGSILRHSEFGALRTKMARSLGFHVEGFAPLSPDVNDPETAMRGATHRFA